MFIRRIALAIATLILSTVALAADKIPVVASFSILGDLVTIVGGERVSVRPLVGPDQDAHVFEPQPVDLKAVAQARLVVFNGLGFEGWMERLIKSSGFKGTTLIASRGIKPRQMADDEQPGKRVADPHAWQDPRHTINYVRNIAAALTRLDPAGEAVYRENSRKYIDELTALDSWAQAQYASIPAARRRLITSHDAFGYHSNRYGIRFLAPQGISSEDEPSAREMATLIRQIRKEQIKALFMENMSNPKILDQLAREAAVVPAGKLYADSLSKTGGPAPSYLKMMRYNVETILNGLRRN